MDVNRDQPGYRPRVPGARDSRPPRRSDRGRHGLRCLKPRPLGIYSGTYDASAPGSIKWKLDPEVRANSDRKKQKWFGMAEANGALYASNNTGVFKRIDGPSPRWERLADSTATGEDASTNPEWRGLVGVPNPKSITGWPEPQMLLFSYSNAMWRMEAGGPYRLVREYDLKGQLESQFGYAVPLAEAAFNRPIPLRTASGQVLWPIGFQFAHSSPPAIDNRAFTLLRDSSGHYTQQQILDPSDPNRVLIVARDLVPSPFPSESGVLYATGYNSSASNEAANRGTAWVARGIAGSITQ